MKYEIYCSCGDTIEADSKDEAEKKFLKKHNFPLPYTEEYWNSEEYGYAEEFEINEV